MRTKSETVTSWLRAAIGGLFLTLAMAVAVTPAHSGEDAPGDEEELVEARDESADETEPSPSDGTVGGQMGEGSLEKFIPTEEISADGAVSFPVDI